MKLDTNMGPKCRIKKDKIDLGKKSNNWFSVFMEIPFLSLTRKKRNSDYLSILLIRCVRMFLGLSD